jgi:hypothetical protein
VDRDSAKNPRNTPVSTVFLECSFTTLQFLLSRSSDEQALVLEFKRTKSGDLSFKIKAVLAGLHAV